MMGSMAGKTVLITGATSGIGRATAIGLAAMGAHLAITGRDRVRTEDAGREIRAAGAGGWNCSSQTCLLNPRYEGWLKRYCRACLGSMC